MPSSPPNLLVRRRLLWSSLLLIAVVLLLVLRHFTRDTVTVTAAPAIRGDLTSTLSTNGITEPENDFQAHAPQAGIIKRVYVRSGDQVSAGKPLVDMDDSEAQARLATATAGLAAAQAQYDAYKHGGTQEERLSLSSDETTARANRDTAAQQLAVVEKLQAQGASSPSEVAAARSRLASADSAINSLTARKTERYAPLDLQHAQASLSDASASVAAARDLINQLHVRAPFAGTVYSLPVQATEFVNAGDKLLSMADLRQIRVRAYFDEPEIGRLQTGLPISIVWDARPNQTWHGHITQVPSTIIDYGTRHVGEVLVSVDDSDGTLLPHTNVTVTVTLSHQENALLIPREALHVENGKNIVYEVLKDRVLRRRSVQVGASNLTSVQITSGLADHALVALSAANGEPLTDRMPIQVVQ